MANKASETRKAKNQGLEKAVKILDKTYGTGEYKLMEKLKGKKRTAPLYKMVITSHRAMVAGPEECVNALMRDLAQVKKFNDERKKRIIYQRNYMRRKAALKYNQKANEKLAVGWEWVAPELNPRAAGLSATEISLRRSQGYELSTKKKGPRWVKSKVSPLMSRVIKAQNEVDRAMAQELAKAGGYFKNSPALIARQRKLGLMPNPKRKGPRWVKIRP